MDLKRGFHRIFIVLAVSYLMPVAIFTIALMPEQPRVLDSNEPNLPPGFVLDTPTAQKTAPSGVAERTRREMEPQQAKRTITTQELLARIQAEQEQKRRAALPELMRIEEIDNFRRGQVKVVFTGFLVWAIPLALIYSIGKASGWIIAGFRESKA